VVFGIPLRKCSPSDVELIANFLERKITLLAISTPCHRERLTSHCWRCVPRGHAASDDWKCVG